MSLVINVPVTFTFNLEAYATPAVAISLVIVDGAGIAVFDQDGIANGAVYTPPTDTVQGSYIFDYTFDISGNWSIILADGVTDNYQILHNERLFITEGDDVYVRKVSIDPAKVTGAV